MAAPLPPKKKSNKKEPFHSPNLTPTDMNVAQEVIRSKVQGQSKIMVAVPAELYFADGRDWKKQGVGVACWVKEKQTKNYSIRVVDVDLRAMLFQQVFRHCFDFFEFSIDQSLLIEYRKSSWV
eukprot:TRINITY_DN12369_c1_g1_i6.p5 TRINITY_DN12369_c1_g1~~TRINITY_DN12369_c1_g1_i6.p5  ORF type:complete len:123 (+),score=20.57 TRINITY_DN12369_c1_g1_i6:67-435(+)